MSNTSETQAIQTQLMMTWKSMLFHKQPLPKLDEVHFRACSQNGEDGILLFVFALIGTTNKKVLEICAGDGKQCNAANLILNHGWEGFLFDGSEENVAAGNEFYRTHPDTRSWPPKFKQAWITRDNITDLVSALNLDGEIDLLSLDIDGNDYWIFEALTTVNPRVFITEYQQAWGPDIAVTQRYQEDFDKKRHQELHPGQAYEGASLRALVNLADKKGLRLIGCERKCFNAVFLRKGLAEDIFPTIDPAECFSHVMARFNRAWLPATIDPQDPFWHYL